MWPKQESPEFVEDIYDIFHSDYLNLSFNYFDKKCENINSLEDLVKFIQTEGEEIDTNHYVYGFSSEVLEEDVCFVLEILELSKDKTEREKMLLYPEKNEPNLYRAIFKTDDGKEYMFIFKGEF